MDYYGGYDGSQSADTPTSESPGDEYYWDPTSQSWMYQGAAPWTQNPQSGTWEPPQVNNASPTLAPGSNEPPPQDPGSDDPTNWFTQNAPQQQSVPGFGETYSTPARPDYLQGEYKPPVWTGGDFTAPTMDDVMREPGFLTGLQSDRLSRERSAAAQGSILNGGTQVALQKRAIDYGATKYADYFGRAFDTYREKYGQFQDTVNSGFQARGINENAYQNDVGNSQTQYATRYKSYLDSLANNRTADNDYWNQNQDVIGNSLTAQSLARPNG